MKKFIEALRKQEFMTTLLKQSWMLETDMVQRMQLKESQ